MVLSRVDNCPLPNIGLTLEAIDELQMFGMTLSKVSLNAVLKVEENKFDEAPKYIKSSTEQGKEIDLEKLEESPHIHLGESNFPTTVISNGKSMTDYFTCFVFFFLFSFFCSINDCG
jgi:hypothetical protein